MAEKVLENPVCESCGVDVRPHSMFCYNCGGAVSDEIIEETAIESKSNGTTKLSEAWLSENFGKEEKLETVAEKIEIHPESKQEILEKPLEKVETKTAEKTKSTDIQKDAKLKSAATMRRKAKSFQAKRVEVVWEEPENSSTVKLILVALLLLAFAAAIVVFALYLK